MQIEVTELEARRIVQCIQDRIDLFKRASQSLPITAQAAVQNDVAFLESIRKKVERQLYID